MKRSIPSDIALQVILARAVRKHGERSDVDGGIMLVVNDGAGNREYALVVRGIGQGGAERGRLAIRDAYRYVECAAAEGREFLGLRIVRRLTRIQLEEFVDDFRPVQGL